MYVPSLFHIIQGNYIKQTKSSLQQASSAPLKTYEGHRFFAAWADEADQVMTWDPDTIPATLQFVHRGFDQVVTAKVKARGPYMPLLLFESEGLIIIIVLPILRLMIKVLCI